MTSGVLTTLGIMIGLYSSTHSAFVAAISILFIAVGDGIADAVSVHVSTEFENHYSTKQIWEATLVTFFSKFILTLTFIIPFAIAHYGLMTVQNAVIADIVWGVILVVGFNYYVTKLEKVKPYKVIIEHLAIMALVIVATYLLGQYVNTLGFEGLI